MINVQARTAAAIGIINNDYKVQYVLYEFFNRATTVTRLVFGLRNSFNVKASKPSMYGAPASLTV